MYFSGDQQAYQQDNDSADYLEAVGHQKGRHQLVDFCHLLELFAHNPALFIDFSYNMNVFIILIMAIDSTGSLRYPFCE